MTLTHSGSIRSALLAGFAVAMVVGCSSSSSSEETREPSDELALPRRQANGASGSTATGNGPDGPQSVSTFAPPPAPECKVADDCKGPLPDLACLVCWDGSNTCTRHSCVDGKCDVVFPSCPPQCASDADCRAFADTCGGCNCRPLGVKQADPKCGGDAAACFADPCGGRVAACDLGSHLCVVK
jgi:hypothetical protein